MIRGVPALFSVVDLRVADFEGDADVDGAADGGGAGSGGALVVVGGKKKSGAPAWVDEDDASLKVTHVILTPCFRYPYPCLPVAWLFRLLSPRLVLFRLGSKKRAELSSFKGGAGRYTWQAPLTRVVGVCRAALLLAPGRTWNECPLVVFVGLPVWLSGPPIMQRSAGC